MHTCKIQLLTSKKRFGSIAQNLMPHSGNQNFRQDIEMADFQELTNPKSKSKVQVQV